jgi:hypothetical protein
MAQELTVGARTFKLPTSSEAEWGTEFAEWMAAISGAANAIVVTSPEYGATGDGVTDDTAAIQAAIDDATAGTTIIFPLPAVYYKITSSLTVTGKTGLTLQFSKSSVGGVNLYNTYAGPAILISGSTFVRVTDASIRNTQTSTGVGIHVNAMSYEVDLNAIHVRDGFAGLQLGDMDGNIVFNIRIQDCKFESYIDSPVTLTHGIAFYCCVNVMGRNCYTHACAIAYKRYIPTAGATVKIFDNIHMFHCIGEYCTTSAYELLGIYHVTLERPYAEGWGTGDGSPTSYAINVSGLSYTDINSDSRTVSLRVIDAHFHGEGSQSGGGKLLKVSKYFHYLQFQNPTSSIPRTTHLELDDEDATDRGNLAGRPLVILEGREYGVITLTNSAAIIHERGISGGNSNLNTVAPSSKADPGSGVARGGSAQSIVSAKKFAIWTGGVYGQTHQAIVADSDELSFNKFDSGDPNNSFDADRALTLLYGTSDRKLDLKSPYWNTRLRFAFRSESPPGSAATIQATDLSGSVKVLQLNPDGGPVQVGKGTYDKPMMLGSYYLWIDGSGRLLIKSSAPSSASDGTIVGTQS